MSWVTRATAADGFVESWVSWRESCEEVRAAYRRWSGSSRTERGLAFDGYREHHAARVYVDWAERLDALER